MFLKCEPEVNLILQELADRISSFRDKKTSTLSTNTKKLVSEGSYI
jgi:hypothetical protein